MHLSNESFRLLNMILKIPLLGWHRVLSILTNSSALSVGSWRALPGFQVPFLCLPLDLPPSRTVTC